MHTYWVLYARFSDPTTLFKMADTETKSPGAQAGGDRVRMQPRSMYPGVVSRADFQPAELGVQVLETISSSTDVQPELGEAPRSDPVHPGKSVAKLELKPVFPGSSPFFLPFPFFFFFFFFFFVARLGFEVRAYTLSYSTSPFGCVCVCVCVRWVFSR
jgi:hypothetical protein